MIVICTKCQAKFRVADEKVGPRGAKVRCSRCQTVFRIEPEGAAHAAPAAGLGLELERPRPHDPSAPAPLSSGSSSGAPTADPFGASPGADPFARAAGAFAAPSQLDPFGRAPSADPFASAPASDPFAVPAAGADPFAAPPARDPFAAPAAPSPSAAPPASAATDLGDLLAAAAAVVPPPLPRSAAAPRPAPTPGGIALEERPSSPPRPASSAPFDLGMDAGDEAFAAGERQVFDPGAVDLSGPPGDVPALATDPGAFRPDPEPERPSPPSGAAPRPPAAAAPARAAKPEPHAQPHARIPDRPSRLRSVVVNAVALAALLIAAAAILALWRADGPIDAAALRPSAILSSLRGRAANVPFDTRDVRSGLYERERAPPLLFVRGDVVSRAHAPVARVEIRVEVVRNGAVVASGRAIAGAVPTPEELWGAGDAEALAAVAAAAGRRAPARIRPGEAVPFLVAIADQPADLSGTSLRVKATPAAGAGP